jgi:hypothetical protein
MPEQTFNLTLSDNSQIINENAISEELKNYPYKVLDLFSDAFIKIFNGRIPFTYYIQKVVVNNFNNNIANLSITYNVLSWKEKICIDTHLKAEYKHLTYSQIMENLNENPTEFYKYFEDNIDFNDFIYIDIKQYNSDKIHIEIIKEIAN